MSRTVNIATSASVAFLAGFLVSVASSPASAQEPKRGGTLVYALTADPPHLNAALTNDLNAQQTATQVFSQLIRVNKNAEVTGDLAESWSMAPDGLSYTFKLRQGVTFSNGKAFTADDVVFSINTILDPKNGAEQSAGNIASVASVKKVDDYTVEFTTKEVDPALPARLAIVGISEDGTTAAQRGETLIGTGPYKQASWDKSDHIKLTARSDYWGPKPKWQTVNVFFRPEDATRISALKTGEVQLAADISPELAATAPKVEQAPQSVVALIRFNTLQGPLTDPKLREAVNLAIDRKTLVDKVYGGYAVLPNGQPIGKMAFGYNDAMTDGPYDPAKAKQLVRAAGGNIPLTLMGSTGRTLKDSEAAQAVAAMLDNVGFKVTTSFPTLDKWVSAGVYAKPPGGPDLVYVGHGNEVLDAAFTAQLYFGCHGEISRYCSASLDKTIASADSDLNIPNRAKLYGQVWQSLQDANAFAPLANLDSVSGTAKDVVWTPRADGFLHFDDIAIG